MNIPNLCSVILENEKGQGQRDRFRWPATNANNLETSHIPYHQCRSQIPRHQEEAHIPCCHNASDPSFHHLNIFRFHLDGGSEIALLEVNEEAFELAAAFAHQTTFETIETTTDNAYLLAIDLR